ncbi:hypothetical protein BU24DRAFT_407537 [Aaosphaeria arxii CBS 175.79]|uniref:Uncharacterized protein n=1 Tax=Aaosphaeria arxii CBS 175.79 TaxID=1450172 RepID=A0A6A5XXG9_9PLEO|nr:uncharacterized protein BU24DRAFT_407537 [Aaosphaeria arxii CBS 175.79]KAF2017517.1 hypothetical protein BU24DRAFT_407537 [Aaosphaeria arxii CBS 175.79]
MLSPRSLSPRSDSSMDTTKSRLFTPLSPHGLPKARDGPHRFSSIPPPINLLASSRPSTPMSLSMMSPPPMSARSIETFIDSTPSTPAYSPRAGWGWDGSTIVLLSPGPSATSESEWAARAASLRRPSRTPSPVPVQHARKESTKSLHLVAREITPSASLSSHPVLPMPVYYHKEDSTMEEESSDEKNEEKTRSSDTSSGIAPFGKIAKGFKSMLKRKGSGTEKRAQRRRREHPEMERIETMHWTEM